MSYLIKDAEIQELIELGKPKPGDDEQMVVFRTMIRASVTLATTQNDIAKKLAEVEEQTEDCKATKIAIDEIKAVISPADAPNNHIDVRLTRLEETNSGIMNILKSNSGAIILALLYGGWQLIQAATK